MKNILTKIIILSFILLSAQYSYGDEALSVGRMRVAIWPEYDDPGVLVIYDGRFSDSSRFPTETSFLIPKGAVISDACSLSPKGQHFCQLYNVVSRGDMDEVRMRLPFSNFYLSFHISPFDAKTEKRDFIYRVKTNHPIETLEVDIQQPLRSEGFNISPSGSEVLRVKDFSHFKYAFANVSNGEEKAFMIDYIKKDGKPSVDIKYSPMTGPRVWGSPYDTQRRIRTYIYIVFGTGIAGLAGIAWLFLLRKRRKA